MPIRPRDRASLVALLVGVLLLSYPLINVPNRPLLLFGVPLLYLYLFVVWIAGVGVAWWLSRAPED